MFDYATYLEGQFEPSPVAEAYSALTSKQRGEIVAILSGTVKDRESKEDIARTLIFLHDKVVVMQANVQFEILLKELSFKSIAKSSAGINIMIEQQSGPSFIFTINRFDELHYFVDCLIRPSIEISTQGSSAKELDNLGLVTGSWEVNFHRHGVAVQLRRRSNGKSAYWKHDTALAGSECVMLIEAWNLGATHLLGVQHSGTSYVYSTTEKSVNIIETVTMLGSAYRLK